MRVATRRLLKEKIVAVVVLERGEKNDTMWHMPQGYMQINCENNIYVTYDTCRLIYLTTIGSLCHG